MKKLLFGLFTMTAMGMTLVSCGEEKEEGDEKEGKEQKEEKKEEESCTYKFEMGETDIQWTAYKHGAKAPVPGTFKSKSYTGTFESDDPKEILTGLLGTVMTNSVYSNDTARDRKLRDYFFYVMSDSSSISAQVVSITETSGDGTNSSGTCQLEIEMNGMKKTIDGKYSIEDTDVQVIATMNIPDWEAQDAMDSINEACAEKHTGEEDAEPVTWPDVKIVISTTLSKECE